MNFASDNAAGAAPQILDAIAGANAGFALGYGEDPLTRRLERRFCELFEREVALFLVPTGTAANALALAQLTPPWGAVLCHEESHVAIDECGAAEFYGAGMKLIGLAGEAGKITAENLRNMLVLTPWGGPHHARAAALTLTQPTEAGTLYSAHEVRELARIAREFGLHVHMDGARFANALARTKLSPAAATWSLGVDVLSFGATKNGALAAEAVVFFDPARADGMAERRKRGGHLLSKHRFVAAQLEAYLTDDLWLDLARHANLMADLLAARVTAEGLSPVWPVESNAVFVRLPRELDRRLRREGASYYPWPTKSLAGGTAPHELLARFVTSFATSERDVEQLIEAVQRCKAG